jgi:S-adenosyl-L-methionine hydrolase (adenosine-forming)
VGTISLMTDFGIRDGNVGVMKGVIWGIDPEAKIADLSHLVAPQNIRQAALILARTAPYFPAESVHVVVVDPGVGTQRRAIAGRIGSQKFVGPDNGVVSVFLAQSEARGWPAAFVHLDQPQYWLEEISDVFHGRDIFSPVGAHLAAGVPLEKVGTPIDDLIRIELPKPERGEKSFRGQILHIDHFGNLATNLTRKDLEGVHKVKLSLRGTDIPGLYRTFGELEPGELMALFGSTGSLIVSEVNGSAAARLGAQEDDIFDLEILD